MPTLTPEPATRYSTDAGDFFCMPFDRVLQVLHVDEVLAALQGEGPATASLTPDAWGRRHSGNVALEYDFPPLVASSRFFWLGAVAGTPERCRFLVTTKQREGLVEYDPRTSAGPWRCEHPRTHAYNSRFDVEFVFEDCPSPLHIRRVFCVEHDAKACETRGAHCPDRGRGARSAGARLLATLIGEATETSKRQILPIRGDMEAWLVSLVRELSRHPMKGTVQSGNREGRVMALRAVAAFQQHDKREVAELVCSLASPEVLSDELRRIVTTTGLTRDEL